MAIKKRNKTNPEFSMSSLTDIIFLLLIFFMLTSSMVKINIDLPESESRALNEGTIVVMIDPKGKYFVNGREVPYRNLRKAIAEQIQLQVRKGKSKKHIGVAIAAEKNTPWKKVNPLLDMISSLGVKAILATKPKKKTG